MFLLKQKTRVHILTRRSKYEQGGSWNELVWKLPLFSFYFQNYALEPRRILSAPNWLVEVSPTAACFNADTERNGEFNHVFHLLF